VADRRPGAREDAVDVHRHVSAPEVVVGLLGRSRLDHGGAEDDDVDPPVLAQLAEDPGDLVEIGDVQPPVGDPCR
jgi:hypothetical protein